MLVNRFTWAGVGLNVLVVFLVTILSSFLSWFWVVFLDFRDLFNEGFNFGH